MPFSGFPKEGLAFLKALKKNNTREWFQPRKETYDLAVKAPMEQLVDALNAQFAKFAPQFITEPKKAVYRLYRDTRFSKDKTPYKTHIAASFTRAGMAKHVSAGYYFSVAPDEIEVGAGIYMPGPEELRILRNHIAENHEDLTGILKQATLNKLMGGLVGDKMSRVPKGFPAGHPAAEILRHKYWILFDTRLDPALAASPKFLTEISKRFQASHPFVEFFNNPLLRKRPKDPLLSP